jgi:hypothetical protein
MENSDPIKVSDVVYKVYLDKDPDPLKRVAFDFTDPVKAVEPVIVNTPDDLEEEVFLRPDVVVQTSF